MVLQESIRDVGTVRENSELVGPAEGAFAADVHVNGCKAEVVASVILLSFGQVQVPRHLRHKPVTITLLILEEVWEFVDEPAVGQSWRGGEGLLIYSSLVTQAQMVDSVNTWVMWRRSAGQEGSCSFIRCLRAPAISREVVQICKENREDAENMVVEKRNQPKYCPTHTQT